MKTRGAVRARVPVTPGDLLREDFMEPLNLTQAELARRARVPRRRINEILLNKRDITPDTALRFEAVFGVSAQFWLNIQTRWDLWRVREQMAREYGRIRRIEVA